MGVDGWKATLPPLNTVPTAAVMFPVHDTPSGNRICPVAVEMLAEDALTAHQGTICGAVVVKENTVVTHGAGQ